MIDMKKIIIILIIAFVLSLISSIYFLYSMVTNPVTIIRTSLISEYLKGNWKIVKSLNKTRNLGIEGALWVAEEKLIDENTSDTFIIYIYYFNSSQSAWQYYQCFIPSSNVSTYRGMTIYFYTLGLVQSLYVLKGNTVVYLSFIGSSDPATPYPGYENLLNLASSIAANM